MFPKQKWRRIPRIGTEAVKLEERKVSLLEYAIVAKSFVISTPLTRTGLISLPCRLQVKVTQELQWRFVHPLKVAVRV